MRSIESIGRAFSSAFALAAMIVCSATSAYPDTPALACNPGAPTPSASGWDNSGDSLLSGPYYFRYVQYTIGDQQGDLSHARALYKTITFDGKGNYTIDGSLMDSGVGATAQPKKISGNRALLKTSLIRLC